MNHCGQSPLFSYCWAKRMRRIPLAGSSCSSDSSNSMGPWQTSRTPQAPPAYCSRPCGAVRCTIASCASHGKMASIASTSAPPSALLMRMPRVTLRQKRSERASMLASATGSAYFAASALACLTSVNEPTTAKTNSFVGRVRIAAKAALSVGVKQFVPANGFDALGRACHKVIDGLGILFAPSIIGIRPKGESLAPRFDLHSTGMREFLLAEDEMAE